MRIVCCILVVTLLIAATKFDVSNGAARKGGARNSSSAASSSELSRSNGTPANQNRDADAEGSVPDSSEPSDPYAAERLALLGTAEAFLKAYAAKDAAAIASQFAPEAEYQDSQGHIFQGRKSIEETLKEFFDEHPQAALEVDIESIRFLSPDLAIEDGSTTCTPAPGQSAHYSPYVAIHSKIDGKWLLASVREHAPSGKHLHAGQLRQLEWLVGDWVDQDDDSVVHFNCQFTDDGNFLIREFKVTVAGESVISGTQRSGWDPSSGKIRSWTFDSDGGYFEGTWNRHDASWVLTSSGVTSDGHSASGTSIFTPVNRHTMTWQMVDLTIEGTRVADSEEYTLVRLAPKPEMESDAQ